MAGEAWSARSRESGMRARAGAVDEELGSLEPEGNGGRMRLGNVNNRPQYIDEMTMAS